MSVFLVFVKSHERWWMLCTRAESDPVLNLNRRCNQLSHIKETSGKFFKEWKGNPSCSSRVKTRSSMKLDRGFLISIFKCERNSRIREVSQLLAEAPDEIIHCFSGNEEICEAYGDSLSFYDERDILLSLMSSMIGIIPKFTALELTYFVDSGIVFKLVDLLNECDMGLVSSVLGLATVIAQSDSYGSAAVVCGGIPDLMIDMALNSTESEFCLTLCNALIDIMKTADCSEIDEMVTGITRKTVRLLQTKTKDTAVLNCALQLLVTLTNKNMNMLSILYENDIDIFILRSLEHTELIESSLSLAGNLVIGHAGRVKILIEQGFLQKLLDFLGTEFTGQALWVISNIAEKLPHDIDCLASADIVTQILSFALRGTYAVKRECAHFLATLVVYSPTHIMSPLVSQEMIDLFVDVMACENESTLMRCLDALTRLMQISRMFEPRNELRVMLSSTDVINRLADLMERNSEVMDRLMAMQCFVE